MILFGVLLHDCTKAPSIEGVVLSKSKNSRGDLLAIVTRTEGGDLGATVGFGYRVYIRQSDPKDPPVEVLREDKSEPPRVSWSGNRMLQIALPCGQVFDFTNFAVIKSDQGEFEKVSIKLDNDGLCSRR